MQSPGNGWDGSSSLNQLEWFKFNLVKMISNYIVMTTKKLTNAADEKLAQKE